MNVGWVALKDRGFLLLQEWNAATCARQNNSVPSQSVSYFLKRMGFLAACLLMPVALHGCIVSQATHDKALQRIQSLEAANATLKTALDTAQAQANRLTTEKALLQTDHRRLQDMLSQSATVLRRQGSAWEIQYGGMPMLVVTSAEHDRMRIMALVGDKQTLSVNLDVLMQANFDRALDARYALFQGKLWATYLHPLRTLTESELASALAQVANLVKTYGTTYSSSNLHFQEYK